LIFFLNRDDSTENLSNDEKQNKEQIQVENGYAGQIEYAEGSVEKREGENSGWFTAQKSDVIKSGDQVRTLADSRAIITFEDGSSLRLKENTTIVFDSQENKIAISLPAGAVYNKVAKNPERDIQ
jgi:ferric-dicitrate binding protein FerR (iron transport regulator)